MCNKISLCFIALFMAACSNSNSDQSTPSSFMATYELQDTCSTGRQTFVGASETDIAQKFCTGIKDNNLNNNCANYLRQQVFQQAQCTGAWPNPSTDGTLNSSSTKTYGYQVNGCSTGLHFYGASDDKTAMRMYCKGLQDESYNQNCAKSDRDKAFSDASCPSVLQAN